MNTSKLLWDASKVYAPTFPRQSSDSFTIQDERESRAELVESLEGSIGGEMPGYYSVYSFPRGHSKQDNIPRVDCLFVDLDVPGDDYQPNEKQDDYDVSFEAWERSMSGLLTRARMIAHAILDLDRQDCFRAVLSGHKGIHLYLDFPPIDPAEGNIDQFKAGLSEYGDTVMTWLDQAVGGVDLDRWVDVDGSDLGRLARHPNTVHHETKYDEQERWCVPVSIEELADLYVDDYLELTRGPREVPEDSRSPSPRAGAVAAQYVRMANPSPNRSNGGSTYNPRAVENYEEQANDDITLADLKLLTRNKPCIKAFRQRDDAYDYGDASRVMELSIMGRFIEMGVPRDVMHEFFSVIPGYSEDFTNELIDDLIGRNYGEFNCQTITSRAPQFCLGDQCGVYRREGDIQK